MTITTELSTHCACGHARATHEHYRRGSDCSLCGTDRCARYRSGRSAWIRLFTR